jgi:hypothetical protein
VLVYYEPVTFLLTSDEYPKLLQDVLIQGLPEKLPNCRKAQLEIENLVAILSARRSTITQGGPSFAGIVGATQIRRLLRTGRSVLMIFPSPSASGGGRRGGSR